MATGEWHEETTADGDVYVYPPDGSYYNRYLVGNGNYTNGLRRDHVRLFVNAARLLAACKTALDCLDEYTSWQEEARVELKAAIAAAESEEE